MTSDEKKVLEKRLENANRIERRVNYLKDAVKRLSYREKDSERFANVCWSSDEGGLSEEIAKAVRDIISKRLTEAEAELEKS